MANNFLKYGDLLLLYQTGSSQAAKEEGGKDQGKSEGSDGLLSCIGFTDHSLYLQELPRSPGGEKLRFNSDIDMVGLQDCVFSITPKLNYDFHYEYKQTLVYYKNLESSLQNSKTPTSFENQELFNTIRTKLKKLEIRMKKEEELNQNIIRENQGKPILYGSEIQIMHYDSGCFIKATNDCSTSDGIGYKCELNSFFSSGMIFRVTPRFRSRQEGDAIQLRDNLILKSMRHNGYLTVAKQINKEEQLKKSDDPNPFLVQHTVFDSRVNRFTVYLSQEYETSFQALVYRSFENNSSSYIFGGDIVRITHTEIQADLSTSINHHLEHSPEVYFRMYRGDFKEEFTSMHSYWIAEQQRLEDSGERFEIASNSVMELRNSARVRLRNFVTGSLIGKNSITDSVEHELHSISNLAESHKFVTLELEPVVRNNEYLMNSQIYFVSETESTDYLKYRDNDISENYVNLLEDHLKRTAPQYPFFPLPSQDINEVKYPTRLNKEFSSEDAYVVQKAAEVDKRDMLFVRSTLPMLSKMKAMFNSKSFNKHYVAIFAEVISTLKQVIAFLFELDISKKRIDFMEIEGMPIPKKQKLLKDSCFLDSLISLIYLPFANGHFNLQELTMDQPFSRMLEMSYTTLRYAIKEYRPNELYASQWIDLIIDQSLKTSDKNDIRAGQTLTELIDNNQRVLESRIKQDTILQFVDILKEDKDAKYVEVLRAICICDGLPMIKNQKDITREILENSEVKSKLVFGIEDDSRNGVIISLNVKGFESVSLLELYGQKSSQPEDAKVAKTCRYVISMVRLLSDLCMMRNYLAIDILKHEFTYGICFEIIKESSYDLELREAFTVLMVNLWIDVSPLQAVDLPQKIKVWDKSIETESNKQKDQPHYMKNTEKLKVFIFDHLNTSTRQSLMEASMTEDNCSFDLAILKLTE